MDKEITPLKDFDKSINYYQLMAQIDDLIQKTLKIKTSEEISNFINVARAFIFGDETLKSIFLNNVENFYKKKNSVISQEEIEQNIKALTGYLNQAGYKYSLSAHSNIVIDETNRYINLIEDYYFPSFYKYAEQKLNIKIEKDYLNEGFFVYDSLIDDIESNLDLNISLDMFLILNFDDLSYTNIAEYNNSMDNKIFKTDNYFRFYYKTILLSVFNDLKDILEYDYCPRYYPMPKVNKPNNNNDKKNKTKLDLVADYIKSNPHKTVKEIANALVMKPDNVNKKIKILCEKHGLNEYNKTALINYLLEDKK